MAPSITRKAVTMIESTSAIRAITCCRWSVVANLAAPDEATDVVAAGAGLRSRGRARAAARVTAPSLPPGLADGALGHELQHTPGAAADVTGTTATEAVWAEDVTGSRVCHALSFEGPARPAIQG